MEESFSYSASRAKRMGKLREDYFVFREKESDRQGIVIKEGGNVIE
jgi:hypothetical protein